MEIQAEGCEGGITKSTEKLSPAMGTFDTVYDLILGADVAADGHGHIADGVVVVQQVDELLRSRML